MFNYIVKVKLATVVGCDPKAPFSIATPSLDCSTLPLMPTL